MKVILTTNIKKLGKVGDQVIVKDGFARNFLFPNKMALRDTKNNLLYYEKIKEEITIKENEKKEKALNLVENIKKIEIKFTKEADEKVVIFIIIFAILNLYSFQYLLVILLNLYHSLLILKYHIV